MCGCPVLLSGEFLSLGLAEQVEGSERVGMKVGADPATPSLFGVALSQSCPP